MSADLFAAFGIPQSQSKNEGVTSPERPKDAVGQNDEDQWILQSQPAPRPLKRQQETPSWNKDSRGMDVLFDASDDDVQDEDDFGDFEAAETEAVGKVSPSHQQHVQHTSTDLLGLGDFSDLHVAQLQTSGPTLKTSETSASDLLENEIGVQPQPNQYVHRNTSPRDVWSKPSILSSPQLVADVKKPEDHQTQSQSHIQNQESTDDDWGNFEDAETVEERAEAGTIADDGSRNRGEVLDPEPMPVAALQTSQTQTKLDDDQWDDFEDDPIPSTTNQPPNLSSNLSKTLMPLKQTNPPKPQSSSPLQRPTNIPPPSTLLQLLPQIYRTLTSQSRLPTLSPDLAQQILQIYVATAHILAGRALRWKRDTLLSQSTRISQAGLKNTGMKLTALDKSETIKEDQEAQEVVSAWTRHAAALNAVMLKAKVQKPPMSLSVNMGVKSASGAGVLTSKECCAVCGLKRNERVLGIDVSVEDSFGEFWVDFWGHRGCTDFWYTYEEMLKQR